MNGELSAQDRRRVLRGGVAALLGLAGVLTWSLLAAPTAPAVVHGPAAPLVSTPQATRVTAETVALDPAAPPHWYLAILGTDPAHQGCGVGGALIRAITDRCDEEGLGAYLESSKERNVPYYARHGFEVRDQITSGDGPPMWLMWRDPKG